MVRWWLPLVLATSVLAAHPEPCQPIDGIRPLLEPGTILLLGEIHGTEESPAFALHTACHAARSGLPVIVGLELRAVEQARVDAFLASSGTDEDRRALLAGSVWQAGYQDGRASHAMVDLIDGLRVMRGEGHEVRVIDRRRGSTLAFEPAHRLGIPCDHWVEDLHRDLAVEP